MLFDSRCAPASGTDVQIRAVRAGKAYNRPMAHELDYEYGEPVGEQHEEGGLESRGSQLLPATFLKRVVSEVLHRQPGGVRLNTEARGRLAKFWLGRNSSIHYEIWLHDRTMQLEIGLHCESMPEHNAALYAGFDRAILDIQQQLGAGFWLEEWDRGWIRLYETHPLRPLDAYRASEVADRLLEIIAVIEPVYRELASHLPEPPQTLPFRRQGDEGGRF